MRGGLFTSHPNSFCLIWVSGCFCVVMRVAPHQIQNQKRGENQVKGNPKKRKVKKKKEEELNKLGHGWEIKMR